MPEIPDIENFTHNLKKLIGGKQLAKVKVLGGKHITDTAAVLNKQLKGKKLLDIYRAGKEMRFRFEGGIILGLHLMLTGDLFLFDRKNEKRSTLVEFYFNDGTGLALTDRMKNAYIKLNPEEKGGIDALDPALNSKKLKELLNRKAVIKNVLLNQELIKGIGNSYSDEILWQAKISPFSIANAIPEEKVKELSRAIKSVLKSATKKIMAKYPGSIQDEKKEFLKVHTKKKTHSPTGYPIIMADRGMLKTFYTKEQVVYK